jgi:diacylglycerol kinase (ATP)
MKDEIGSKFSIRARIKSFDFAFKGLGLFFATQHNAWIHLAAMVLTIVSGYYFSISVSEWCLICMAIGFVIFAEIVNTAIEFLTNIVSPEYNKKAGEVKDLAAAAVLVSAITAVALGLIVFIPKIYALL